MNLDRNFVKIELSDFQKKMNLTNDKDKKTNIYLINVEKCLQYFEEVRQKHLLTLIKACVNNRGILEDNEEVSELLSIFDEFKKVINDKSNENSKEFEKILQYFKTNELITEINVDNSYICKPEDLDGFKFCRSVDFKNIFKTNMFEAISSSFENISGIKAALHQNSCKDSLNRIYSYLDDAYNDASLENILFEKFLIEGYNSSTLSSIFIDFYKTNPIIVEQKIKIYLDSLFDCEDGYVIKSKVEEILKKDNFDKNEFIETFKEILQQQNKNGLNENELKVIGITLENILNKVNIDNENSFFVNLKNTIKEDLSKNINYQKNFNKSFKGLKIFNYEDKILSSFNNEKISNILSKFSNDDLKISGKELKSILALNLLDFSKDKEYIFSEKTYEQIKNEDIIPLEVEDVEKNFGVSFEEFINVLEKYDIKDTENYSYSNFLVILKEMTNYKTPLSCFDKDFMSTKDFSIAENTHYQIKKAKDSFLNKVFEKEENEINLNSILKNILKESFYNYGFFIDEKDINIDELSMFKDYKELLLQLKQIHQNEIKNKSFEFNFSEDDLSELKDINNKYKEIINSYYKISGNDNFMNYVIPALIDNLNTIDIENDFENSLSIFELEDLLKETKIFESKLNNDDIYKPEDFKNFAEILSNNFVFRQYCVKELFDNNYSIINFNDKEQICILLSGFANNDVGFGNEKLCKIIKNINEYSLNYKPSYNDLLILNNYISETKNQDKLIRNRLNEIINNSVNDYLIETIYKNESFKKSFEKYFNSSEEFKEKNEFKKIFKTIIFNINIDEEKKGYFNKFLSEIEKDATKSNIENFSIFINDIKKIINNEELISLRKKLNENKKISENYLKLFIDRYNQNVPETETKFKLNYKNFTEFLNFNTRTLLTDYSKLINKNTDLEILNDLKIILNTSIDKDCLVFDNSLLLNNLKNLEDIPFLRDLFLDKFSEKNSENVLNIDVLKENNKTFSTFCDEIGQQLQRGDKNTYNMFMDFKNYVKEILNNPNLDEHKKILKQIEESNYVRSFESFKELIINQDIENRIINNNNISVEENLRKILEIKSNKIEAFVSLYNEKIDNEESKLTVESFIKVFSNDVFKEAIIEKASKLNSQEFKELLLSNLSTLKNSKENIENEKILNSLFTTFENIIDKDFIPSLISDNSLSQKDFYMSVLVQHSRALDDFINIYKEMQVHKSKGNQIFDLENTKEDISDEMILKSIKSNFKYQRLYLDEQIETGLLECIKKSNNFFEVIQNFKTLYKDNSFLIDYEMAKSIHNIFNEVYKQEKFNVFYDIENLSDVLKGNEKTKEERTKGLAVKNIKLHKTENKENIYYAEGSLKNLKIMSILSDEFLEHFNYEAIVKQISENKHFRDFCHKKNKYSEVYEPNMATVVVAQKNQGKEDVYGILLETNDGKKMVLTADMINEKLDMVNGKPLVDEKYSTNAKKEIEDSLGMENDKIQSVKNDQEEKKSDSKTKENFVEDKSSENILENDSENEVDNNYENKSSMFIADTSEYESEAPDDFADIASEFNSLTK